MEENTIIEGLEKANIIKEAKASCELDGETQTDMTIEPQSPNKSAKLRYFGKKKLYNKIGQTGSDTFQTKIDESIKKEIDEELEKEKPKKDKKKFYWTLAAIIAILLLVFFLIANGGFNFSAPDIS